MSDDNQIFLKEKDLDKYNFFINNFFKELNKFKSELFESIIVYAISPKEKAKRINETFPENYEELFENKKVLFYEILVPNNDETEFSLYAIIDREHIDIRNNPKFFDGFQKLSEKLK